MNHGFVSLSNAVGGVNNIEYLPVSRIVAFEKKNRNSGVTVNEVNSNIAGRLSIWYLSRNGKYNSLLIYLVNGR